ncbi:unnamed protein product [Oikopleura dioica]|uniref:Tetraspanin n=1 Tax=Oikopleura dioica TaxID=34765 RepID=E4XSD3_OIKDI|nr:unnamed protein product [Oikopleura dioica]
MSSLQREIRPGTRCKRSLHPARKCCGINGSADFLGSTWADYEENLYNAVPRSCCKNESKLDKCEIEGLWSQIYQVGCQAVFSRALLKLASQTRLRLVLVSLAESCLLILFLIEVVIWKRNVFAR